MVFTDIFMVRDDLVPAKFRGMSLEETYCAFPIHSVPSSIKPMEILQVFEDNDQAKQVKSELRKGLKCELKNEVIEEVKSQLRKELKNEVIEEVKSQLRKELKTELIYIGAFILALTLLLVLMKKIIFSRAKKVRREVQGTEVPIQGQHG